MNESIVGFGWKVSKRECEDGFSRPTVEVFEDTPVSLDVVVRKTDGNRVIRINIAANKEKWANVDVIIDPDTHVGTFMAWKDGKKVVNESPEGVSVFAVDVSPRTA